MTFSTHNRIPGGEAVNTISTGSYTVLFPRLFHSLFRSPSGVYGLMDWTLLVSAFVGAAAPEIVRLYRLRMKPLPPIPRNYVLISAMFFLLEHSSLGFSKLLRHTLRSTSERPRTL